MNQLILQKQIISLVEFLKENKATVSSSDFDSTGQPFFTKERCLQSFEIGHETPSSMPQSMNRHFKNIYKIIGNPSIEIYIGEWTILSLHKVLETYEKYKKENQELVLDLAYRYAGMGWIQMLSCNLYNHLLFYRDAGGSNGWDREANHKKIIHFDHTKYKYFYFEDWKKNVNNVNNVNNV